jgi:hypothetical protein
MSTYSDTDSDELYNTPQKLLDSDDLNAFIMCEDYMTQQLKKFLLNKIDDEHQDTIYAYQVPADLMMKTSTLFKMYKILTSDTTLTITEYKDNLLITAMNLIRFESRNAIQYEIHRYDDVDNNYNHVHFLLIKS